MTQESWSDDDVRHFPKPLNPDEIEKILSFNKDDEAPDLKIKLEPGNRVKIKEGPFENYEGSVSEIMPALGQVRVIVTVFGRDTPVDLEYWQVEKI